MSTSINIHRVVKIDHFVRRYETMITTTIVVVDDDGRRTELVLYSDAPLTIPEPRVYRVGIDHCAVAEVAP